MRQFIVLGHEAATDPEFTLKDLPGSAGRLDVLCRCINAAFFLSHDLRRDVRLYLVLQDSYTVRLEGEELQYLNPDEWSTASLLKKALQKKEVNDASEELRSTPGIYIAERGFADVLESVDGTVIQLHEEGDPASQVSAPDDPVFVLSDHQDFTEAESELLAARHAQRASMGPKRLHANHAIVVAHNFLDTNGYQRY